MLTASRRSDEVLPEPISDIVTRQHRFLRRW